MRKNVFASVSLADSTAKGAKKATGYYVPALLEDPDRFLKENVSPLLDDDEDRTIMLSGIFGRASDERTFSKKLTGEDASATALETIPHGTMPGLVWSLKTWILDERPDLFAYIGAPRGRAMLSAESWFKIAADLVDRIRYFLPDTTPIFDNDGRSAVEPGLTAAFYAILARRCGLLFGDDGFSFGVEPNPILDPAPMSQRPINVFEFASPQYCCASVRCWEAGDANPGKFLSIESCVTRGMIPLVTVLGGEFSEKSDRISQARKWGERVATISSLGKVFVGGVSRSDLVEIRRG